ncbi:unnamed protein product [Effrenium voratum]|nr:unnamed protein product [Effrenium voratum]
MGVSFAKSFLFLVSLICSCLRASCCVDGDTFAEGCQCQPEKRRDACGLPVVELNVRWLDWVEWAYCVDSPFFSTILLGFWRFSGKKDPCKEWKWKVPVE